MEKHTLHEIANEKFKLVHDFDILDIEEVQSLNINYTENQKTVTIHIGFYDYFFNGTLKNIILDKIKKDLGSTGTKYKFAI